MRICSSRSPPRSCANCTANQVPPEVGSAFLSGWAAERYRVAVRLDTPNCSRPVMPGAPAKANVLQNARFEATVHARVHAPQGHVQPLPVSASLLVNAVSEAETLDA